MLGTRAAMSAQLLRDPAVALLSSLAADVDATSAAAGGGRVGDGRVGDGRDAVPSALTGTRLGPARRRLIGAGRPVPAPVPAISGWARAVAAGAVIAGVAGTTSVVAAGMLARLARGPARGPRRSAPAPGVPLRPWRTR
jgi:hypothetical protein